MKNFSKPVKIIIDKINKTQIKDAQMLGVEISEILFVNHYYTVLPYK